MSLRHQYRGTIDVGAVTDYARTLPGVTYAEDNLYSCSQNTQERIKAMITEHDLNRVVIASCTPRTHEALFQATLSEAGLNPYLLEFVNIRSMFLGALREPVAATEKPRICSGWAPLPRLPGSGAGEVRASVTPVALVIAAGLQV
jgi:heterodisulfide reductase subunit A